jgi:zinc protease
MLMVRIANNARSLLIIFLVAVLCSCGAKNNTATDTVEQLPFSDKIISGTLDNGVRYYIKKNDFPSDKVELRLNIRSGSLNETEKERGVAHFVEHMAFNGTKNFQGNDLIKFMDSVGLTFGQHSNAYTSSDNTNYKLSVPADNAQLIEDSFMILRDWADGISFDPEEIEKEKGVITEEWRGRNDVRNRMRLLSREYLLEGSLYVHRDPIGLMEVIAGANKDLLKGYYDKWYTAGNMSVMVVGNIEPEKAKELVEKYFASLENKKSPEPADGSVPLIEGLRIKKATDPEATSFSVTYSLFRKEGKVETYPHLRQNLLELGAMNMLNKRVASKILEKQVELLGFRGGKSETNGLGITRFTITSRPESFDSDIREMLTEIERVKRYGFTQDELQEFVISQKTFLDRAASPNYKHPSEKYVDMIVSYDNYGGHLTEFTQDKLLLDRIFAETTLNDYHVAFNQLLDSNSKLLMLSMPERDADKVSIDEEKFNAILDSVASTELERPDESGFLDKLIDKEPKGGVIVSKVALPKVDGTLITYGNGTRLFVKNNTKEKNRFSLTAKKQGGLSVLSDEEVLYTSLMQDVISASGFAGISRRELQTFMADKRVNVAPSVTATTFDFGGGGDSEDLETFFQLIYKLVTAPDVDPNALAAILKSTETAIRNNEKDKQAVFFRDLSQTMLNDNYRRTHLIESDLEKVTSEKLLSLYKKNFTDINNFIFVISGDVDADKAAELGRIYLGGLPSSGKESKALNREVKLRNKFGRASGYGDVENRSTVLVRFDNDIEKIEQGEYYSIVLRRILNQKLRESVREDMGGVYSVSTALGYTDFPATNFSGRVSFTCDPARQDEIIDEVLRVIKYVTENGVTEKELAIAKNQHSVQLDSAAEQNRYWIGDISNMLIKGEDVLSIEEKKEILNSLTLENVNKYSKEFLKDMRVFVAVYNPEVKVD